jgi:glutaredoxin
MVKEFLSQRGIGFKEYDVSRDPSAAQELVRSTGQMGVPVTVINGQAIVGFDRSQTINRRRSSPVTRLTSSIPPRNSLNKFTQLRT